MSKTTVEVMDMNAMQAQFIDALRVGMDGLQRAGELLVKMIGTDPTICDTLIQKHGLQRPVLAMLEKIGRGVLLPRIAIAGGRLARLNAGEQRRVLEAPVEALVLRDGTPDTIKVDLMRAPREMQEQLIDGDHIRTLDEQRAWLVARANATAAEKTREAAESMPWIVSGKTINIVRPIKGVTRGMLLTMMKALES